MEELKQRVKKDLESKTNASLVCPDVENIKCVNGRVKKPVPWKIIVPSVAGGLCLTLILAVAGIAISTMISFDDSFKKTERKYSQNEIDIALSNSFSALNSVTFPSENYKNISVDEQFALSMNTFGEKIYDALEVDSDSNLLLSPMTLYANLAMLLESTSNQTIIAAMEELLGSDLSTIKEQYKKAYENDYYVMTNGTIQMYNGVFLSNLHEVNMDYIDALSSYYAEAFQLDFMNENDVQNIINWLSDRSGNQLIDINDLDITIYTRCLLFSTLYFKNNWKFNFDENATYQDKFYLDGSETKNIDYMRHSLFGSYYDYGDYISIYDYYSYGSKIKYIVPKSLDDNIHELISDTNIFVDDASKIVDDAIIDLSVPKINLSSSLDLSMTIAQFNLESIFDNKKNSFDKMFEQPVNENIYLEYIKQANNIGWDESGTTVQSITLSMLASSTAPAVNGGIEIKLNQPFVFIIYDSNDLPLLVGAINNPS